MGEIKRFLCDESKRGTEMETREEYMQLAAACDFLEHYHIAHTDDMISRFRGKGGRPDIYIVSDKAWKSKLRNFTKSIFPD
jgi:hypothetical protein